MKPLNALLVGSRPGLAHMGLAMALLLSGCSLSRFEKQISSGHGDMAQRTEQANALLRSYPGPTPAVVTTQRARFTTQSIPIDRSEMLPSHIASVTLRLPGRHSVKTIATLIERATDIPVNVSSDATMPASQFVPIGMSFATPVAAPVVTAGATGLPVLSDKQILDSAQRAGRNAGPLGRQLFELTRPRRSLTLVGHNAGRRVDGSHVKGQCVESLAISVVQRDVRPSFSG